MIPLPLVVQTSILWVKEKTFESRPLCSNAKCDPHESSQILWSIVCDVDGEIDFVPPV